MKRRKGAHISTERAESMIHDAIGEPIYTECVNQHGETIPPNDIPTASVIIIDEAQHWFPMKGQGAETPHLLTYLSMLRHHLHWAWFISQDRMMISITIRRMCQMYWVVRNIKDDVLVLGLKLGHLGIAGFGYLAYTPEQEPYIGTSRAEYFKNYVRLPFLPWRRHIFRLYRSFTHVGSFRALRRGLERAREQAGLTRSGIDSHADEQRQAARKEKEKPMSFIRRVSRAAVLLLIVFGVAVVGFAIGAARSLDDSQQPETVSAVEDQPPAAIDKPSVLFSPGKLDSLGNDHVRSGGARVFLRGQHRGGVLRYISREHRSVVWLHDGDVWVQRLGEESPIRVGTVTEAENSAALLDGDPGRWRSSDRGGPTSPDGVVGAPNGLAPGGIDSGLNDPARPGGAGSGRGGRPSDR